MPLVAAARAVLDVLGADVDFFVVAIEVQARGVGYTVESANDESHAAGAGAVGSGGFFRGGVEEVEDVLDLGGEVLVAVDVGEEDGGAFVGEVAEFEAEEGSGEGVFAEYGGCGWG